VVVLSATTVGTARSKPVALTGQPLPLVVKFVAKGGRDEHVRLLWAQSHASGREALDPVPPSAFRHEQLAQVVEANRLRAGRHMFIENRCIRCHNSGLYPAASPQLLMDAPNLDGIGSRVNPGWLRAWLIGPKTVRSTASMPRLFPKQGAKEDVDAVAAYLGTLRDSQFDKARDALAAEVDARIERETTSREKLDGTLMTKYMCGGCHTEMGNAADDGRTSLSGVPQKFPKGAVAAYLQNPAAHYAWNPMPNFRLSRKEAVELEIVIARMGWKVAPQHHKDTPDKIARGKRLVQEKGCLSCHHVGAEKNNARTLDLLAGAKGSGGSCVDATIGVDYGFTPGEAAMLKAFVTTKVASVTNYAPGETFTHESSKLRCGGCHGTYEGFPELDNLGAKLRPEFMAAFIAGRVPYKPRGEKHPDGHAWLPARMPGFGPRARMLAEGLAAQAGFGPTTADLGPADRGLAQVGAQLVSADGGFSCNGCHAIGNEAATQVFEAEGINLAYAADRLRPEFFRRWVRNPLKIDPQTKMPTYFDETGASPLEVLGGDGDKQIDAMWNFARTLQAK
jgi:mono/diheme cytochrome c family protein